VDAVTIRAHFDGEKIIIDEPYELEPNSELIITVLPKTRLDQEREEWFRLARQSLGASYGDDEPEYPLDAIKEFNPEYEGR